MKSNSLWGAAVISIVVASWFFYRYLLPKSWREWTRAGMVQAFIIAFYAEMYGFPVTIYALTRIFKLDISGIFWDGNLWVYLTGKPSAMLISMTIGYTISIFGILLLIAGWVQIYHAKKESRLTKDGPYALVRHPQYTGIFLAIFGEGVIHWPTIFSLTVFPIIVLSYVMLARKEEKQMLEKFGREYREYQQQVPMFFPHLGKWQELFKRHVFHNYQEHYR